MERRQLDRMAGKYRLLLSLRRRREELAASGAVRFGSEEGAGRRRVFRRIARAFPGSLRELDACSAATLALRLEEVERACAGAPVAPWIPIAHDFHRVLREALLIKGWLARRLRGRGRGMPTDGDLAAFARMVARLDRLRPAADRPDRPTTPAGWAELAERHLRPAEGSLLALVWRELEVRHGVGREAMERMLFGSRG